MLWRKKNTMKLSLQRKALPLSAQSIFQSKIYTTMFSWLDISESYWGFVQACWYNVESARGSRLTFFIACDFPTRTSQHLMLQTRVSKLLSMGNKSCYTTVRGPDIMRNQIASGYVTFYQINKFFVNVRTVFSIFTKWLRGRDLARGP